jgi:hypothetical protein
VRYFEITQTLCFCDYDEMNIRLFVCQQKAVIFWNTIFDHASYLYSLLDSYAKIDTILQISEIFTSYHIFIGSLAAKRIKRDLKTTTTKVHKKKKEKN